MSLSWCSAICRSGGSREPPPCESNRRMGRAKGETHRLLTHGSRGDGFRCALPILRGGEEIYLRLISAHSVLLIPNSLMNPSASSTPQSADCAYVSPLALSMCAEATTTASTPPPRVSRTPPPSP